MDDFVDVDGEKSPKTPSESISPTIDLNGSTQEIVNPIRSTSPEIEELLTVIGRKKTLALKNKKVKILWTYYKCHFVILSNIFKCVIVKKQLVVAVCHV